nr:DNA excision repair protein ERCC-5 homolog [Procambarus clarkii]
MGVKGLWKLIESTGVPVPLETLEHKILAVDVSIWLHQAVRGFRGPGGAAVANAHLLTLFHRICKLLFYRIRPVFVFDGGVPYLKKQTLASRKIRRDVAASKAQQVRERLLKNLLKSQAVRKALGRSGPGPSIAHVARPQKKEKDMFELPPIPDSENQLTSLKSEDSEDEGDYILKNLKLPNLHQFDFESKEFKSLAIETQHEILCELQDTRKQNSWSSINEMPRQSESFAEFQMGRLMKRRNFQATLDSTRDEIRKRKAAEMEAEMFGELQKHVSLSQRIISEDDAHSILVKRIKNDEKCNDAAEVLKVDKGKSPMKKRNQGFGKDFLTELAKQGVVRAYPHTDSDSDFEDTCYPLENSDKDYSSENEIGGKRSVDTEEEGFLNIVSSLMENSGLTQEEILTMIKQESSSQGQQEHSSEKESGPSTSENAPGFVCNPDADSASDDDEDFIEVLETSSQQFPQSKQEKDAIAEKAEADNLDKLLSTKSDSLWMKIIHQKLDDMVHTNAFKTSPKKAVLDSRKLISSKVNKEDNNDNGVENLKAVKISLDFDVKPLKMEDDIFADIFTEINKPLSNLKQNANKNDPARLVKPQVNIQDSVNKATNGSNVNLTKNTNKNELLLSQPGIDSAIEDRLHGSTCSLKISASEQLCTKDPKISSVCSAREMSSTKHKNLEVDKALQNKVNELVKLKIEELVNSKQKRSDLDNLSIMEEQDQDDVELMSSSEESDCDEMAKNHLQLAEKPKLNTVCTTIATTTTDAMHVLSPSDSASNSNIEEVWERDKNTLNVKINCEASKASSNAQQENGINFKPVVEQQSRHTKSVLVTDGENDNRENTSDQECLKKQPVVKNANTNIDHEAQERDLDSRTKCDQTLNLLNKTESENVEVVERPQKISEDELKHLEGELAAEQKTLVAQAQKSDRIASNLNEQMYGESQHLLQLFGIPYLVAPMEAEAQCAFLDSVNLTGGTITDDSDIFLFGGCKVYRNFFNQARHVEFFNTGNIKANIGLDRHKMITLALLTGSDYTEGVESVGSVTAMEILAEFPGEGIECLHNLKKWWNSAHKNVTSMFASKVKQKLSRVMLLESFPNERVYEAYLEPEVDESREKFTWAVPNVEALRTFTMEKFGWNLAKADEILLPVLKKLGVKTSQMRIDSYFTNIKLVKEPKITSKRMQDAIAKAKGESPPSCGSSTVMNKLRKSCIRGKPEKKKRNLKDSENMLDEAADDGSAVMVDSLPATDKPTSSKPSKTLLMDPSESSSNIIESSEPKRKRKKKSENSKEKVMPTSSASDNDNQPPRKLTKEIMYKALLEKETISQRESDKMKMQEKKLAAAQLLKKQRGSGKAFKR